MKAWRSTSLLRLRGVEGEGRRGKANHAVCLGQFFLYFLEFLILLGLSVAHGRTSGITHACNRGIEPTGRAEAIPLGQLVLLHLHHVVLHRIARLVRLRITQALTLAHVMQSIAANTLLIVQNMRIKCCLACVILAIYTHILGCAPSHRERQTRRWAQAFTARSRPKGLHGTATSGQRVPTHEPESVQ